MADEHGVWQPLSPREATSLLSVLRIPWWIAGGWAIDLFVGRTTRPHDDIDVQIIRDDQLAIQELLLAWDLHAADPPGTLRPWKRGEVLPPHVHDVWCRPDATSPCALQLMLADTEDDRWIYRRDRRVSRPLSVLTRRTTENIPYLTPEIQLLFKARHPRPKDESDFAVALPFLDDDARAWLGDALRMCYPNSPWLPWL